MIDTYDNVCVHVYWGDNGVHDWKLFRVIKLHSMQDGGQRGDFVKKEVIINCLAFFCMSLHAYL